MGREQASLLERGADDTFVDPTIASIAIDDVAALLSDAQAVLDTNAAAAREYLVRAVALLRDAATIDAATDTPCRTRGLAPWQLKRLTTHIDLHLGARLRTADLAAVAGLSVSHFSHAFKSTVGVPPAAYVGRRRIEAARAMIEATDEPLTRIAHLHGFCDQSHFTRTFRRELGMAPQAWRRLKGAGQSQA
jgi:AraC-like DNA-binding protein